MTDGVCECSNSVGSGGGYTVNIHELRKEMTALERRKMSIELFSFSTVSPDKGTSAFGWKR